MQSSHTNFSLSCNHSSAPFNGFRRKNKADYDYNLADFFQWGNYPMIGYLVQLYLILSCFVIEGLIRRQLRCEKLPQLDGVDAHFTDIAVHENMLLTTQNASNEILVFKLNF